MNLTLSIIQDLKEGSLLSFTCGCLGEQSTVEVQSIGKARDTHFIHVKDVFTGFEYTLPVTARFLEIYGCWEVIML